MEYRGKGCVPSPFEGGRSRSRERENVGLALHPMKGETGEGEMSGAHDALEER